MSETVERVAEAIKNAMGLDGVYTERDDLLAYARAAIEAIREPTIEMVAEGNSALSANGVDGVEDDDAALCFKAMIDASLKHKQTESEAA